MASESFAHSYAPNHRSTPSRARRWEGAFLRLSRPRLLVPPILQILVLSKRKQAVQDWVKRVSGWGFNQIIPAHLEAPIKAGPREFKDAFSFLQNKGGAAPAGAAGNGAMQLGGLSLPFLALPALAPANEARGGSAGPDVLLCCLPCCPALIFPFSVLMTPFCAS